MKLEKQNIILNSCWISAILCTMYAVYRHDKYLESDYGLTAGQTIDYEFNVGFKDCIAYKYYVENKKFTGCVVINEDIKSPLNKFYVVKYSVKEPEISEIDLLKEIKDSSKIAESGFKLKKANGEKFP